MAETNRPLGNRILIGLVVGAIAGTATLNLGKFFPPVLAFGQKAATAVLDPFGQDRLLDMTQTMVNVGSDLATTVVVDAQVNRAEARAAAG